MTNPEGRSADEIAAPLSEDAVKVCLGFFLFGSKVELNISPPHNTLQPNKAAFDELVEAGLISHSYDDRRDIHTYKGTTDAGRVSSSQRGRKIATAMLGAARAESFDHIA